MIIVTTQIHSFDNFEGERRIRVHTICLPTTSSVSDVINGADQEAIVSMLAKFGGFKIFWILQVDGLKLYFFLHSI